MMRAARLAAAALLVASAGCRALTETTDEQRCRQLNALVADTAQMRVGETRRFQATGFQPSGTGSCAGTLRGGFTYTADAPAVASVERTTGVVRAVAPGSTKLRAQWRIDGAEYTGQLDLRVLP